MKVTQMSTTATGNFRAGQSVAVVSHMNKKSGIDVKRIFEKFEKDDYILAGIILVLIFEGCDDYILLAALGYLFFMGLKEE